MTQPEIKKYRRKVSDERVMRIANETESHPEVVKMILEADAEVIEGKLHLIEMAGTSFCKIKNTHMEYKTLEQFNAKWEEIE
jgi:hypothetical protein